MSTPEQLLLLPFWARSQLKDAAVLAGWLLRQDWSVVVAPRLKAKSTLPVLDGLGAPRLRVPLPLLMVTADGVVVQPAVAAPLESM